MNVGLLLITALLLLVESSAQSLAIDNGNLKEDEVSPYRYDLSSYTALTLEGNAPETNLVLDFAGLWNVAGILRPRKPQTYPSLGFTAAGEWEPYQWLSFNLLLDTGELRDGKTLPVPQRALVSNGYQFGYALSGGTFICELNAEFMYRGITAQVGRYRSSVGSGLVYDDFGTGANARIEFDQFAVGPWSAELGAVIVGRHFDEMKIPSPLLSARVDWNFSWFESIGLFAALFVDRNGESAELVRNAIAEQAASDPNPLLQQFNLESIYSADLGTGNLGFFGFNLNAYPITSLSLHVTGVWSVGSYSIPLSEIEKPDIGLSAYALDLDLHYGLGEYADIGLIGFALSGGEPQRADGSTYRTFIGVAPYWVWTGIFFSGGLNQGLLPRRAAAAGINGHGVIGGGPVVTLSSNRHQAQARAIWLRAFVDPPAFLGTSGRNYGWEIDGTYSVELFPWLSLSVETDFLIPGSYLPSSDLAYRIFALVRGSYGS
jgi:hypothetical protein